MRATKGLAVGIVAVAVAVATAAPVQAQQQNNQFSDVIPLEDIVYNSLTDEWVYIAGNVYLGFDVVVDQSGGAHINFQFRAKIDGYGLSSGKKYAINNSAHQSSNFNANNPQYNDTFTQHWKMISQGSGANGYLRQTYHFTINANGTWTANVVNEAIDMGI